MFQYHKLLVGFQVIFNERAFPSRDSNKINFLYESTEDHLFALGHPVSLFHNTIFM